MSRNLQQRAAAHLSWANTTKADRTARSDVGRKAFFQQLLDKYDGDEQRARHAYKAHFQMMAYKSAEVRRANREARRAAKPNPGVELIKQLSATLTPEQRAQALEALKAGK